MSEELEIQDRAAREAAAKAADYEYGWSAEIGRASCRERV